MRNVLGAVLFLAAAAFLFRAWRLRRSVLASVGAAELARRRAAALADPRSLSAFGEIARPLVLVGLGWLALKTTLAYVLLDGQRVLSWFDLAGFLAVIAAYGAWFSVRATHWVPDQAATAPATAETMPEPMPATMREPTALPLDAAEVRSARRAA